jgi:pilus assembly protein CpaB
MQGRNIAIVAIALFFGLIAVYLGNIYFKGVEQNQQSGVQQQISSIVVASQDVPFGTLLGVSNLRLASWPADSIPAGAFTSLAQATKGNRVAVRPMVAGEPVLASKVSGADGRAALSATLPPGKVAYTIPISDVSGVGGFVRPGDLVDVLLTRSIPGDGADANDKMADVVLKAVPVLGIDLVSDESQTKPVSGKTATLEVDIRDAQKLALSIQLGALSLALRNVTDQQAGLVPTVIGRQLSASNFYIGAKRESASAAPVALPAPSGPPRPAEPSIFGLHRPGESTITIVRSTIPSDYEVQRAY